MTTRIQAEGLGKMYRHVSSPNRSGGPRRSEAAIWALRGLDLCVGDGEVLGIVGPNGAGKTTLLKLLAEVTCPTEGRLLLRGRVGSILEAGAGFHGELSGRENVYLSGTILGMRKREIDRRFDEIVEFSGVEDFLDTPVKRYSSGMYMRLAFAVVAHLDTEILVVDEVLAVGDAEFQKKCLGTLDQVGGAGRTVLFVSHNLSAVERVCTRAILLEHGKVTSEGTPREVVDRYLGHVLTAPFVAPPGATGSRILEARVRPTDRLTGAILEADSIEILVGYALDRQAPDVDLEVSVATREGVRIIVARGRHAGFQIPSSVGEHFVALRLPHAVLQAGEYVLGARLLDGASEDLDVQEPALAFSVRPDGSGAALAGDPRRGVLHVDGQWDLRDARGSSQGSAPAQRSR